MTRDIERNGMPKTNFLIGVRKHIAYGFKHYRKHTQSTKACQSKGNPFGFATAHIAAGTSDIQPRRYANLRSVGRRVGRVMRSEENESN